MPVYLRKFYYDQLADIKNEEKKQIEKGSKGWDNWPPTYDLTGDFKGQGKGSKIKKITSLDQIKY